MFNIVNAVVQHYHFLKMNMSHLRVYVYKKFIKPLLMIMVLWTLHFWLLCVSYLRGKTIVFERENNLKRARLVFLFLKNYFFRKRFGVVTYFCFILKGKTK